MVFYLLPVIFAFISGYLAQKTRLCMVRGVQELIAKRPGFLVTILCCGFWFWLITPTAIGESLSPAISRYSVSSPFIFGGLLFGFGAALNKGCSISTVSKLSRGHFYMAATVIGWLLGWCVLAALPVSPEYSSLMPATNPSVTVTAMLFILITLIMFRISPTRRPILLGVIVFGVIASVLTYQVPEWSPSQLLNDISAAGIRGESDRWPSLQRYLIVLGLIAGMAAGARKRLSPNEYKFRPLPLISHLLAGIIMGIGASLALGGNDLQLLIALPSFSPAGAITILCMIAGIAMGIGLRKSIHYFVSKIANSGE